jgi:hypothetical protein
VRRLLFETHAAVKTTCQFKGLCQGLALRRGTVLFDQ